MRLSLSPPPPPRFCIFRVAYGDTQTLCIWGKSASADGIPSCRNIVCQLTKNKNEIPNYKHRHIQVKTKGGKKTKHKQTENDIYGCVNPPHSACLSQTENDDYMDLSLCLSVSCLHARTCMYACVCVCRNIYIVCVEIYMILCVCVCVLFDRHWCLHKINIIDKWFLLAHSLWCGGCCSLLLNSPSCWPEYSDKHCAGCTSSASWMKQDGGGTPRFCLP